MIMIQMNSCMLVLMMASLAYVAEATIGLTIGALTLTAAQVRIISLSYTCSIYLSICLSIHQSIDLRLSRSTKNKPDTDQTIKKTCVRIRTGSLSLK